MITNIVSQRKYFIIMTHDATSQHELESMLLSNRFHSSGRSSIHMSIDGVLPSFSVSVLMEFAHQNVVRKILPETDKRGAQTILATLEGEWATAQLKSPILPAANPSPSIGEGNISISDTWQFNDNHLVKEDVEIHLTGLEAALIKKMLHNNERVVSREELTLYLGRDPEKYRGLEMCLSRLQYKFKAANCGARLFRAVRHRGYCLVQALEQK